MAKRAKALTTPKNKVLHLQVKEEMFRLVWAMAELEDCTASMIIRRAISAYLATSLKQAEARQQESQTA